MHESSASQVPTCAHMKKHVCSNATRSWSKGAEGSALHRPALTGQRCGARPLDLTMKLHMQHGRT